MFQRSRSWRQQAYCRAYIKHEHERSMIVIGGRADCQRSPAFSCARTIRCTGMDIVLYINNPSFPFLTKPLRWDFQKPNEQRTSQLLRLRWLGWCREAAWTKRYRSFWQAKFSHLLLPTPKAFRDTQNVSRFCPTKPDTGLSPALWAWIQKEGWPHH